MERTAIQSEARYAFGHVKETIESLQLLDDMVNLAREQDNSDSLTARALNTVTETVRMLHKQGMENVNRLEQEVVALEGKAGIPAGRPTLV